MNEVKTHFGGFKEIQNEEFPNNKKRARRELEQIIQILAQWGVPEELRESQAEEIFELLRSEGYVGKPSPAAVLAVLEGEL